MAEKKQERYEDSDLYRIRHSAAHVMAQAVLEMFPRGANTPSVRRSRTASTMISTCRAPSPRKTWRGSRSACARSSRADIPFVRRGSLAPTRPRQIFGDQPYKLELIDGLEQGGFDEYGNPLKEKPDISIYHARHVRRPVPRPARREHGPDQSRRRQADERGGRLLARR